MISFRRARSMPDPHLLFRNRLDAITLSGAHMCPRGTWLWRERLSRVLRGCCAAVVPAVVPSCWAESIHPRLRKQRRHKRVY